MSKSAIKLPISSLYKVHTHGKEVITLPTMTQNLTAHMMRQNSFHLTWFSRCMM